MAEDDQLLIAPHFSYIQEKIKNYKNTLSVSSPYVGQIFTNMLKEREKLNTAKLLTDTTIQNFCSKASDYEAVVELCRIGVSIIGLSKLHAKIYVFDEEEALITSGNATAGGFLNNQECGAVIKDTSTILRLHNSVATGFGNPCSSINLSDLVSLRPVLDILGAKEENCLPAFYSNKKLTDLSPPPLHINRTEDNAILESLSGWKRLTLEAIFSLNKEAFTLSELVPAAERIAEDLYPNNTEKAAKVRQQLQYLRDLGIVEFIDNKGNYRLILERR